MPATLTLRREGVGIELRRGQFEVVVDSRAAGWIDSRQTIELPLEPGHHTLQVRAGRYSSRTETFDAADGDTITFRCHGAMMWPRYVASILVPKLALSLRRE